MDAPARPNVHRRIKLWLSLAAILLLGAIALRVFSPALNANYVYSSRYLTMRDGVRIAVDLYLPRDLQSGERIPAILLQTRYYRGNRLRKPFGLFWSDIHERWVRFFVSHRYAYVLVDIRGAGASFGTRPQEWSPEEIRDGAQVVDWIIQQPWSSQKVGATGGSYDGAASEFLASNRHPAVKAVIPVFSIFDAYSDMAYPGGVELDHFLEMWSDATQAFDRNAFGQKFLTGFTRFAYKGVRPVSDDVHETLLQAAFREHTKNYDLMASLQGKSFRDEVDSMSPFARRKDTEASGVAIYSFEGWYDAAMPHAAVKRFLNVRTPGSRLILGPWNHVFRDVSPFPEKDGRDLFLDEALRFFDLHLKGIDSGLAEEKPVRYYTVAENKWKYSDSWPPAANNTVYYFGAGHTLRSEKPSAENGSDAYQVDFSAGTGNRTRWNSLFILDRAPGPYSLRDDADKKLLVYTLPALDADTEVTGHPIITLFVDADGTDGNFFVYLEDVDPEQHAHYVTEGLLRGVHRKVSNDASPYADVVPYHSYTHRDALPLVPGQIAELRFDLQPISYLFRKGHSIRIALAGSDRDHFTPPPGAATTVRYHRDAGHPSSMMLPVVARP